MYSTLMLAELVEARYAARMAEAERRRVLRQLRAGGSRRVRRVVRWSRRSPVCAMVTR